jgi:hypothetical protein
MFCFVNLAGSFKRLRHLLMFAKDLRDFCKVKSPSLRFLLKLLIDSLPLLLFVLFCCLLFCFLSLPPFLGMQFEAVMGSSVLD